MSGNSPVRQKSKKKKHSEELLLIAHSELMSRNEWQMRLQLLSKLQQLSREIVLEDASFFTSCYVQQMLMLPIAIRTRAILPTLVKVRLFVPLDLDTNTLFTQKRPRCLT